MLSTITKRGQLNFRVFEGRFTTGLFLDFLNRLLGQAGREVFMIVDGHPVRRAKRPRRWLEENPDRIGLFYLAGYSLQLSPDEVLNQVSAKSNAVGRKWAPPDQSMIRGHRSDLFRAQSGDQTKSEAWTYPAVDLRIPVRTLAEFSQPRWQLDTLVTGVERHLRTRASYRNWGVCGHPAPLFVSRGTSTPIFATG
jgi:hypothetical protein